MMLTNDILGAVFQLLYKRLGYLLKSTFATGEAHLMN
jgi:hypothetical protein